MGILLGGKPLGRLGGGKLRTWRAASRAKHPASKGGAQGEQLRAQPLVEALGNFKERRETPAGFEQLMIAYLNELDWSRAESRTLMAGSKHMYFTRGKDAKLAPRPFVGKRFARDGVRAHRVRIARDPIQQDLPRAARAALEVVSDVEVCRGVVNAIGTQLRATSLPGAFERFFSPAARRANNVRLYDQDPKLPQFVNGILLDLTTCQFRRSKPGDLTGRASRVAIADTWIQQPPQDHELKRLRTEAYQVSKSIL